jgi:hypothetical protein
VSGVNKASVLRAVDRLVEGAAQEGILDIVQVHRPTSGDSQSQHNLDGGRLDDGVEGLAVAHPRALGEPPDNPTSLLPVQRAIRFKLVLEDSLAGHHVGPRSLGDQVPRAVG